MRIIQGNSYVHPLNTPMNKVQCSLIPVLMICCESEHWWVWDTALTHLLVYRLNVPMTQETPFQQRGWRKCCLHTPWRTGSETTGACRCLSHPELNLTACSDTETCWYSSVAKDACFSTIQAIRWQLTENKDYIESTSAFCTCVSSVKLGVALSHLH